MSQATGEAAKAAREVSSNVAGRASGVATELTARGFPKWPPGRQNSRIAHPLRIKIGLVVNLLKSQRGADALAQWRDIAQCYAGVLPCQQPSHKSSPAQQDE